MMIEYCRIRYVGKDVIFLAGRGPDEAWKSRGGGVAGWWVKA